MVDDSASANLAVAAYRGDAQWQVETLPPWASESIDTLVGVLRQMPSESGVIGLLIVDEDFFVVARLAGLDVRYLLSDVTAATDWPIARDVLEKLGLPPPDEEDHVQPAGDLSIFADFGVGPMALAAICDDLDKYPDEMLAEIAGHLGFGPQFDAILDNASA